MEELPPHAFGNNATILQRVKEGYLLWIAIAVHIPKGPRYTLGVRIENKLLDLIELSYIAYSTPKERQKEKIDRIASCFLPLDLVKQFVHTAWEGKLISHNQYAEMAGKLDEIGKMLGGWKNKIDNPGKKNHTV